MGQGITCGTTLGVALSISALPARLSVVDHLGICATMAGCGLCVDFASDCFAKEGRVIIHRDVVLHAQDVLRHVSTFYTTCESNNIARLFRQKHEWLVLESHGQRYYTVQKNPATGDVLMDVRNSLRAANDVGLGVAGRPLHTGEIRLHRVDLDFDLPNDLQVAYMIAWLRKEDPRWAFSTENSRHFTSRARFAIMNKEKVGRRLDLVSSSAGSIISVATWCALQASSADIILAAIDERMRNPSTSNETRGALLYVIHELLLTCARNGVPEAGKRSLLLAISKTLPGMVQAARALAGADADADVFEQNLTKVTSWWSMLNMFPRAWIAQLGAGRGAERSGEAGGSMAAQLRHIGSVMSTYAEVKEERARLLQTAPERAAALREEALRQLTRLRELVHCRLDGGTSLVAWLEAERSALEGNMQSTVSSAVEAKSEEDDDILGSFF